jgi:hypothetical protein
VRERSFKNNTTVQRCDVVVFENSQPVTVAKFINKSSLFILLPVVIRRLGVKTISGQKMSIYSSPRHITKPPAAGFCHLI